MVNSRTSFLIMPLNTSFHITTIINLNVTGVAPSLINDALIASLNAPSIPASNFTALTRLDQNRAEAQIAQKVEKMNTISEKASKALGKLGDELGIPPGSDHLKYLDMTKDLPKMGPYKYTGDSSTYTGQYSKGLRNGLGTSISKQGGYYHGFWYDDQKSGFGRPLPSK